MHFKKCTLPRRLGNKKAPETEPKSLQISAAVREPSSEAADREPRGSKGILQ
jgi:hypothetical protein